MHSHKHWPCDRGSVVLLEYKVRFDHRVSCKVKVNMSNTVKTSNVKDDIKTAIMKLTAAMTELGKGEILVQLEAARTSLEDAYRLMCQAG